MYNDADRGCTEKYNVYMISGVHMGWANLPLFTPPPETKKATRGKLQAGFACEF